MEGSHPHDREPSGEGYTLERRRWGAARVEGWWLQSLGEEGDGERGCDGQQRERGGGGGCKTKGGRGRLGLRGELVGSPPPDRETRPKLALTSALNPSAQVQQEFYCFTGECFLKIPNPSSTGPGRENKEKKE